MRNISMPFEIHVAKNEDENVQCEFVADSLNIFTQQSYRYVLDEWYDMSEHLPPTDGTIFVCRAKNKKHITFEAAIYEEQESWENPERYWVLQNMTTDDPIDDSWCAYEWNSI